MFKEAFKEQLNEAVTFKGMEKKCAALQKALDKFADDLIDFQDIEDDLPESVILAKATHKPLTDLNKSVESLRTLLRKTN